MNLRNNKGYVMTDASIAIIILLILVPTIMGMIYSLNASRRTTETKAQAVNIAVNVIETAKGMEMSDELDGQAILESLGDSQGIYDGMMGTIGQEEINGKNIYTAVVTKDNAGYKVYVDVIDYSEEHNEAKKNILKTVIANVKYKAGGQENEITLKSLIK